MEKAQHSFIAQVTIWYFYASTFLQMNYKVHRSTLVTKKDNQKKIVSWSGYTDDIPQVGAGKNINTTNILNTLNDWFKYLSAAHKNAVK